MASLSPSDPRDRRIEQLTHLIEAMSSTGPSDLFEDLSNTQLNAVKNKALVLLNHRPRSAQELRKRLATYDYDSRLIDQAISDLTAAGLIDDARFAEQWVQQRHRRGLGKKVLDRELQDKGISSRIRAEALSELSSEDEETTARALAEKKARTIRSLPESPQKKAAALNRILGVLARKGYSYGLSMRLAREALDARLLKLQAEAEDEDSL